MKREKKKSRNKLNSSFSSFFREKRELDAKMGGAVTEELFRHCSCSPFSFEARSFEGFSGEIRQQRIVPAPKMLQEQLVTAP